MGFNALEGRGRGIALALVLSVAAVLLHDQTRYVRYTRYDLPDFDPWVYMAMAEHPSVFTLTPWGHRTLKSWLLHALAEPNRELRADRWLNGIGLAAAGPLLFLFLRRLGFAEGPSLAALALFLLTEPFAVLFEEPLLTDSLSVPLVLALLLSVESAAGPAVLALLLVLGIHTKELFVWFLPLVYLAARERDRSSALRVFAAAALPALAAVLSLRLWWTPGLEAARVPFDRALPGHLASSVAHGFTAYPGAILLWGATPLALLGALRREARPFLARYGYLAAATLAAPFVAFLNAPRAVAAPYVVPRHFVYAEPFLLPLALSALARVWPTRAEAPPPPGQRPRGRQAAAFATGVLLVAPFVLLDRYRRAPFPEPLVGAHVLTTCRETLRTARTLALGREEVWDLEAAGWVWGRSDAGSMPRMRWFLREGWGRLAWSRTGEVRMEETAAALLLPTYGGSDLELEVELTAPVPMVVGVAVNGRRLERVVAMPAVSRRPIHVPADVLFRGDNVVTLHAPRPGARLHRVAIRPEGHAGGRIIAPDP
jgi:hypothetical protein